MLLHASWGGRAAIEDAAVLDVFAGTGALGLEALSRGAACACFIENDAPALLALRANIAACKAGKQAVVVAGDALLVNAARQRTDPVPEDTLPSLGAGGRSQGGPGRRRAGGSPVLAHGVINRPASLVFLDPPYGHGLVPRALQGLAAAGWVAPGALAVAETGRDEAWAPEQPVLAERRHGAARILVFRLPGQ